MQGAGARRATEDKQATPIGSASHRGRLRLQPLPESKDSSVHEIEIDLAREDAALTLGDLRRAAEDFDGQGRHETAQRLWDAVGRAAEPVDVELARWARRRAEEAAVRAGDRVSEQFRKCNVRYDYVALARDRADGLSASDTARKHGCSTSTVARAVDFVERRDALLEAHSELADELGGDANPVELAGRYGVETGLMRWMVAMAADRRRRS